MTREEWVVENEDDTLVRLQRPSVSDKTDRIERVRRTPLQGVPLTFTQAVRSVLGSYATFSGRARRSEYWWFYLFTVLVGLAASGVDALLNTAFDNTMGIVGVVTSLALMLPSLAVTARRLHDTGRAGWWMLLPVLPLLATIVAAFAAVFVVVFNFGTGRSGVVTGLVIALLVVLGLLTLAGFIILVVFLCQDSKPGPNKYGPSPKEPTPPVGLQGYYPSSGHYPGPQAPPYGQP